MTELWIVLSFDHELSLGGARSYARNLFEPTEALFELAAELAVPWQRTLMRGFVERARDEYGAALRFVTFREVHDELLVA